MNEIKLPGKIYQVGGSVRDRVMGKPNSDLDYVVVGATAEDMINAGFKQVGKDFPVYLHPITGDEYALARLERKTGNGYHGFWRASWRKRRRLQASGGFRSRRISLWRWNRVPSGSWMQKGSGTSWQRRIWTWLQG